MFLTDAELKKAIADGFHKAVTELSDAWDGIVPDANEEAYKDICGILMGRGFLLSQVVAWDRGKAIQRLQGMYWAYIHGGALHNYDQSWIDRLDQRKNLESMPVAIDQAELPQDATAGPPVSGMLAEKSTDLFSSKTKW